MGLLKTGQLQFAAATDHG